MEINEIIEKLIGEIEPYGDTNIDEERKANIEKYTKILDFILDKLFYNIKFKNDYRSSCQKIGEQSYIILKNIRENLIQKLEEIDTSGLIKIIDRNIERGFGVIDFMIEGDIALYSTDWNGERYSQGWKISPALPGIIKKEFKPVYRYEITKIDITQLEENSDEWNKAFEILGFEEK